MSLVSKKESLKNNPQSAAKRVVRGVFYFK